MRTTGDIQTAIQGDRRAGRAGWLSATALALALIQTQPVLAQEGAAQDDPAAVAQTEQTYSFDISSQPLPQALAEVSAVTGLQILYSEATAGEHIAPALSGSFTAEQALDRLVAGSGFQYRYTGANAVTLTSAITNNGEEQFQLEPITVLGTRRADVPLSNVPSSITIVEREEIQKELATASRLQDVIARRVPGFNPTSDGVRQIRGRTAQVFINGVPTNEQLRASSGSDLNRVSPDQLAGIEVARGANAAFGFGSPGGIIALRTPRAESEELTLRTVVRESFNPHRIGGSHRTSLYQSVSQIVGDFDFQLGGSIAYDGAEYAPDGDLALGFDGISGLGNAKETVGNLDGSFGLDLADFGRLRLTGTFQHVDFLEDYRIEPGVYRETFGSQSEEPRGDQSFRQSYTLNLSYENEDVLGQSVRLEAFTSKSEIEDFRTFGGPVIRDEQMNDYYGLRSAVTTPLDFVTDGLGFVMDGTAITYGVDFLRNRFYRPRFDDDTDTLFDFISPDVTLDSLAPYAQLDVSIGDFQLTGGLRHERYSGEVETAVGPGGIVGGDIRSFNLTLYNAGLVYFLDDNVDLYATFSQGAEISQLGRAARSAATADQVDPQPAKSNQYEIGVRGDWDSLRVGLAGFYTESDLLSALRCDGFNPCTPLREPREFWGVEASADWRIATQWGVGGVLTWQEGVRETESGDVRRIGSREVPPVLVTAYLDYDPFPWWRNTLQLNYRGKRDPFGDSTASREGRVDDLLLVNLAASFDVGPGALQLGVENLLNTEYTSIPAEGNNNGFLWIPDEGARVSLSYSMEW
ncbi:TonB-dependent receptor [Algihabitans albus]|uniref:TonB-dependent receptor domain-containing protein n=1 Tax=Algihabitans albus TaxID=2164067 RepID=UPI0035D066C2